jgi:transcriptional regulator with XRE-family HTH domain
MNRIGIRVRAHRLRCGLSVPGLARAIGASTRYVEMIEAGHRLPSIPMLYRLAEALDVDAGELLSGDLDDAPNPLAPTG